MRKEEIFEICHKIEEDFLMPENIDKAAFYCYMTERHQVRRKLEQLLKLFGNYSIEREYELWREDEYEYPIESLSEVVYGTNLPLEIIIRFAEENRELVEKGYTGAKN